MNIIDTPCPKCKREIEPGSFVMLVKINSEAFGTAHVVCPEEKEILTAGLAKLAQLSERPR